MSTKFQSDSSSKSFACKMAAVSSNDKSDDESWSFSKWWNSSCNSGCQKAEQGLIDAFVDTNIYEYESRQVHIDFDPEPQLKYSMYLSLSSLFCACINL